jgi:hypothetical protein
VITKTPEDDSMKACGNLAINVNDDDNSEDMLVALPKMETEEGEELSTIWLPLKRKHIFNINSQTSTFILFRYFVMVTQCYNFQGINQSMFNRKLKLWIDENVLPYLGDEKLYPAFGAVLRILETIKEPNEGGYQGTKRKQSPKHRRLLGSYVADNEKILDFEADSDVEWWYRVGMAGCGAFVIAFLVIFLICKMCKNRKKTESQKMTESKKSFARKLANCFSQKPEDEDSYSYKKVAQSVAFENEKKSRRQKTMKASKEQFNLPLLGGVSDSEDEVFSKNSSTTSLKNAKFKISESSDDGSSCKKPSKTSLKSPSKPSGIFKKLHAKSPQKGGK